MPILLLLRSLCIFANDCSPRAIEPAIHKADLIFTGRLVVVDSSEVFYWGVAHKERHCIQQETGGAKCPRVRYEAPEEHTTQFKFKVDQIWKGRRAKFVETWNLPGWGWYEYEHFKTGTDADGAPKINMRETERDPPDTRYLIFAWKERVRLPGKHFRKRVYMTSMCTRNGRVSERGEVLAAL